MRGRRVSARSRLPGFARRLCLQSLHHAPHARAHVLREWSDVVTAGKTQCGYRVHDVHDAALIVCSVDDDVARQQQPEVQLGAECLVCERRVAGAENDVRPELYVQLLLQRGAYVDLGEHTEALGRQRLAHALDCSVIRHVQARTETVCECDVAHRKPSSIGKECASLTVTGADIRMNRDIPYPEWGFSCGKRAGHSGTLVAERWKHQHVSLNEPRTVRAYVLTCRRNRRCSRRDR